MPNHRYIYQIALDTQCLAEREDGSPPQDRVGRRIWRKPNVHRERLSEGEHPRTHDELEELLRRRSPGQSQNAQPLCVSLSSSLHCKARRTHR